MANLMLAKTHVPDIVSTLSQALPYLNAFIDCDRAYMRASYVVLRESILNLRNQLNLCKNHLNDEAEREQLLLKARISASKIFSLVYSFCHSPDRDLARCWCCCCAGWDNGWMEDLQRESDETQRLADDFSTFLRRQGTNPGQNHGQESENLPDSSAGVRKLEMVRPGKLHSKIRKGQEVPFTISDSGQTLVYTVTTGLMNPRAGLHEYRRMSARLENATGGVYDIRHPEERQSISGRRERKAFIFSGGSLQGTVTSVLPGKGVGPNRSGRLLLMSDHHEPRLGYPGAVGDGHVAQRYDVLLVVSHMSILGLDSDGVRRLRLLGRKDFGKVFYECSVEATGEVLAIYTHNNLVKKTGVFQLLGVGNKPEVRDLILSTFIAMGLTRDI